MNNKLYKLFLILTVSFLSLNQISCGGKKNSQSIHFLNVSYDPTRELYQEYNQKFKEKWEEAHNQKIEFKQSHGGSGKQARAVIDGLEADVVTLALAHDIDEIARKAKLLPENWQSKLPNNSTPYASTIVFLVRAQNPKQIKDWEDLIKPGVEVITPNPKTSGGARWNYLAAWGYGLKKNNGDQSAAQNFVKTLFEHVPVLDSGARGATTTFAERGIGDVLIAWENEALLSIKELGKEKLEIVYPSTTILAEPPVAVIEENAKKHGTLELAQKYLEGLYENTTQELVAKHFFRPQNPEILKKHQSQFPTLNLFTLQEVFGSWQNAQKTHFADGGTFDQIYGKK